MAKQDNIIIGLDIGTTKICAIVGEVKQEGLEIIGIGTHPSKGLRKGVVVNIDSTVQSIKKAIEEAELAACHKFCFLYRGSRTYGRLRVEYSICWNRRRAHKGI